MVQDGGAGQGPLPSEILNPDALREALRPKSVQELHETVASGRRRGALPPVVAQLAEFVERRTMCEERCIDRLRGRAAQEALLVPDEAGDEFDRRRGAVANAVSRRFSTLENQCSVLCGQRLSGLVGGGEDNAAASR
eukprot:gnl/TRDRNA2_/TRDRNA2_199549_c0_seq1.p1 gnl/TRDRNA2_/TRDRNA2_199549_c0~~gnl/TRDRNA2_/TRDRNA2_199549_c0_seq1.p1  ORF type:complete len:137 (+),score=24.74 gnl/TRDRNA2_/TRDRNA2_199549_c0_seq1:84-494(+)